MCPQPLFLAAVELRQLSLIKQLSVLQQLHSYNSCRYYEALADMYIQNLESFVAMAAFTSEDTFFFLSLFYVCGFIFILPSLFSFSLSLVNLYFVVSLSGPNPGFILVNDSICGLEPP